MAFGEKPEFSELAELPIEALLCVYPHRKFAINKITEFTPPPPL